ncbi:hypothetical protein [Deinococcus sp. UR1]|nr:hypothetical protein [Deinococcus sp. UR1]
MIVSPKPKVTLEAGFTCDACRAPIPPTPLHRVTCPKCRQTYVASPT